MELTIGKDIRITHPTEDFKKWCERELVLDNPEYSKKLRMGFWIGNTPEKLYLYQKNGEDYITPYGTYDMIPQEILNESKIVLNFAPSEDIDFNCKVPLYDYQQAALGIMWLMNSGILQSKAGSGKTQCGIALAAKLGKKTLWLTHTTDLLRQSEQRAAMYMDSERNGTITAGKVNIGECITFATVQTMSKLDLTEYRNEWDVIIVDECHRVCGTASSMTMFYKVLNSLSARHKYGLSATVYRSDGLIKATYALLGKVVHTVPESKIADKVLQVKVEAIGTGVPISRDCLGTDGMINFARMINYLCKNAERNQIITDSLVSNAERATLTLSDRLEHLETLIDSLPDTMRARSVLISGKKSKKAREQAIEDMRNGKMKYLFATYTLAKEGLDIPCLEALHLTTPHKDYAVITQSIGRVARKCDDKKPPVTFDYVDDIRYCVKAWKKRKTIYQKNGCEILG